nr:unnamed protein product [Digitaria exilis]
MTSSSSPSSYYDGDNHGEDGSEHAARSANQCWNVLLPKIATDGRSRVTELSLVCDRVLQRARSYMGVSALPGKMKQPGALLCVEGAMMVSLLRESELHMWHTILLRHGQDQAPASTVGAHHDRPVAHAAQEQEA